MNQKGKICEHELNHKKIKQFQRELTKNLNIDIPDMYLGDGGKFGRIDINSNCLTFLPELLNANDDLSDRSDSFEGQSPPQISKATKELVDNLIIRNNHIK